MAVVKHSQTMGPGWVRILSWVGVADGDTMDEVILPKHPERSVEIRGTFGGGTITIEGSNNPDLAIDEFVGLNDDDGAAISVGGADPVTPVIVNVRENAYRIKPVLTGGDANTDIDVRLLVKIRE